MTTRELTVWDWVVLVARLVLGGAFIALGVVKFADPVAFMKGVREYDIFPPGSTALNWVAATLPVLEVVLGACLVLGIALRGAGITVAAMLLAFTVAVALRAIAIHDAQGGSFCAIAFDCGCGTGVEQVCRKLPENVVMIVLALLVVASKAARFALAPRLLKSTSAAS
jgi:uncharacterized membrane protein YphA (DoxX/SURF4 family)